MESEHELALLPSAEPRLPQHDARHATTPPAPDDRVPRNDPRQPTYSLRTNECSLERELRPVNIFFVAIGAVIGMGFYVRTGQVEAIAGPGTVLLAYLFLGVLGIAIMQDIARLLQIWPIGNPLVEFVAVFVDKDLAIIVAILYWLTYCFSFAGLTTVLGDLIEEFGWSLKISIPASVLSLIFPISLNLLPIGLFRHIETFFGCIKIALVATFIMFMMVINPRVGGERQPQLETREITFRYQGPAGWFGGFSIALLYTSFAFVGIESVAATATEARVERGPDYEKPIRPFQRPAQLVPQVTLVLYLVGGWIVTQNVAFDDPRLPSVDGKARQHTANASTSIFIDAAYDYDSTGYCAKVLRGLLIVNVVSTSSTALYIASRTLFGFANRFSGRLGFNKRGPMWYHRPCVILSKKSRFQVPWVAVAVSAWLIPLPFLKYIDLGKPGKFDTALDLVVEMGSISCILVWACVSFAAFRFYRSLKRHPRLKDAIMGNHVHSDDPIWYWSHLVISFTTALASVSVVICGGIIVYIRTTSLTQFLPLVVVCGTFVLGTASIKLSKLAISCKVGNGKPALWSDLKDAEKLENHFKLLNQLREASLHRSRSSNSL